MPGSIANTFTGRETFSPGLITLGNVARTISGFLTGVVTSQDP